MMLWSYNHTIKDKHTHTQIYIYELTRMFKVCCTMGWEFSKNNVHLILGIFNRLNSTHLECYSFYHIEMIIGNFWASLVRCSLK